MGLPFTSDQFFGVFASYNRAFVVVVVALWLASLGTLAFVLRDPARRSRTLSLLLGVLWAWNAVAYHALFFTRINPAAWLFAALFVVQAVLFFRVAAGRHIEYFSSAGWRRGVGLVLVAYALAYSFLAIALGHSYPETPTFGNTTASTPASAQAPSYSGVSRYGASVVHTRPRRTQGDTVLSSRMSRSTVFVVGVRTVGDGAR